MSTSCRDILEEVRSRVSRGDLAELPAYCIKALGVHDVDSAWAKALEIARSSGEYVILKHMSYVDFLIRRGSMLKEEEFEFMSRDLLIFLEKLCALSERASGNSH